MPGRRSLLRTTVLLGEPYTWLAAIAGVSYVAALVVQRLRG